MQLHVAEDSNGFIKDGSSVLSTAEITLPENRVLAGSFNGWSTTESYFKQTDVEGFLFLELDLEASDYQLKYVDNGTWKTNEGSATINDTTDGNAWEFKEQSNDNAPDFNTILKAQGGHYVFKLNVAASTIEVYKINA
jgi:hypothetical protein